MPDQPLQELRALLFGQEPSARPGVPEAELLLLLAPVLPMRLLVPAMGIAFHLENGPVRARVLQELVARLPQIDREVLLGKVLEGVEALAMPRPDLPEPLREEARVRPWLETLAALAPHVPQARLGEALATARTVAPEWAQAAAFSALAPYLPEVLLPEALAAAREINSEGARADALVGLAPHLPEALLRQALDAVRQMRDGYHQAHALVALVPCLPALLKQEVLPETLRAVRAIPFEISRLQALMVLVPHLSEALLREAFATAREITYSGPERSRVLAALIVRLPVADREAMMRAAPESALALEGLAAESERKEGGVHIEEGQRIRELLAWLSESERDAVLDEFVSKLQHMREEEVNSFTLTLPSWERYKLESRRESLLHTYDLLNKKNAQLEKDMLITAAAAQKFQLQQELEQARAQRAQMEKDLDEINNALQDKSFMLTLPADVYVPDVTKQPPVTRDRTLAREGPDVTPQRPPQERLVNVGFAPQSEAGQPLLSTMPLACDHDYYIWLEVGPPVVGAIDETPTPLPAEHLPPEARLQVALFAFEGEIRIEPGADVGEFRLQPDGTVRVTRQPAQRLDFPPNSDLPDRRLFFPVHTPTKSGTFRLRCNIYCEQILVQSRLIHARVMRRPHPVERALRSAVEYTLTRTINPAYMARVVPHRLSLMLNRNGNGTHGFRFFGEREFKNDASIDGQELQDLIEMARGALRKAAWGDEAPWQGKPYRYDNRHNLSQLKDQLKKDLVEFAIKGYRFYDKLIEKLAGGDDQREQLAELMRQPGLVQVALKESASHVVPVALLYDYDFDTNLRDITVCPSFLAALDEAAPLEESKCLQGNCPSRGAEAVICPSGFWGYRHYLGMPLSVAMAPDAPLDIIYQQEPQFTVGVSTDQNFRLRPAHEQALQKLRPGLGWNYAATRQETFRLLKETRPHVVYFYCHGGVANNVPFLQVGPPDERGITRDNLRFQKIRWDNPHPLVFINGCHTTALEPEMALELVSAFVERARAAGVIGTEITIFEPLACDFAEECFTRFLAGVPIGEAVRGARLALLKKGNPLGLVYIPFVIASLSLKKQSVG